MSGNSVIAMVGIDLHGFYTSGCVSSVMMVVCDGDMVTTRTMDGQVAVVCCSRLLLMTASDTMSEQYNLCPAQTNPQQAQ